MNARQRRGLTFVASLTFALGALAAGCGGGSSGGPSGGGTPQNEVIVVAGPTTMECAQMLPFSQTFQESGASGTVMWSIISGKLPDGLVLGAQTGIISGTPSNQAISGALTIQAADAKTSGSAAVYFQVDGRLSITPFVAWTGHTNVPYALSISAQGGSVSGWSISAGQLPPGLTLNATQNTNFEFISGTPTQVGIYPITIQATGGDPTIPQTASAATSIIVDSHIFITKLNLKNGEQSQPYSDTFVAVNGTPPLTWSISGTLPPGLTLNTNNGQVSGTPTAAGSYPYTVTVTDSSGTPEVNSGQGNTYIAGPLQIGTTSLSPAYVNKSYSAPLSPIGGIPPYSFAVVSGNLPPGLGLDSMIEGISGIATQLGAYTFTLQLTDASIPPATISQSYTMHVTPTPVSIATTVASPAPVNVLYHSQLATSGGTQPYTFSISSGSLPPGLTLDPATGDIDGTPTQIGTYNFLAGATDSSQPPQTGLANLIIQIQKRSGRNDSIAAATPLGSTTQGPGVVASISPYVDPINAITPNPDTDYYRLAANAGSLVHAEIDAQRQFGGDPLDSVIELLDQSGTRLQTCGQPTYTSPCLNDNVNATTLDSALDLRVGGSAGAEQTFYLHVFDWRGDARPDMQYQLTITGVNEPLVITSNVEASGTTRGVQFAEQMTSTGGTGTVTWSVVAGALPPGWTLTPAGILGGVSTTDGTYTYTIQAQDSSTPAKTAQKPFSWIIAEPVTITSGATLPTACVNQFYSYTMTTSGGVPPISLNFFVSGAWPGGISFNESGTLSGYPTTSGTFTGQFFVYDSGGPHSNAFQTFTFTVKNCP